MKIPFVGRPYKMKAVQLDCQNCINWYLTMDPTGKNPQALLPDPGLTLFSTDSSNKSVRALFSINDNLYSIVDNKLYFIDDNGNRQLKGTLQTSVGLCQIIANDYQLLINDGSNSYVLQRIENDTQKADDFSQLTSTISSIQDPEFFGTGLDDLETSGTYTGTAEGSYRIQIDGVGTPNTFKWSNNGGVTWSATTVAITGIDQVLEYGVTIKFLSTGGHTVNDYWDFKAAAGSVFYPPIIAGYLDTYGILPRQNTNMWFITYSDDFTKVAALDYALKASTSDNIVGVISTRQEVWLIGIETSEVWYDSGAKNFPFERRQGLLLNYGCAAPKTIVNVGNNVLIWLAKNREGARKIIGVAGYTAEPISDEALDAEIASYSRIDDAFAYAFEWNSHIFYYITFPTADKTWVFDLTSKVWHERKSWLTNSDIKSSDYRLGRFLGNCYCYHKGKHLIGDYQSGKIYQLDDNNYTENGIPIVCERTTQVLPDDELRRLFAYSLQIDIQAGTGLENGQGDDPMFMLEVSRDGGFSWRSLGWRSGGKVGESTKRVKWNRIGMTQKGFVFRLRVSDPVYRVLMAGKAELSIGEF